MSTCIAGLIIAAATMGAEAAAATQSSSPSSAAIEVPSMLIKLVEQVEVSAREAGAIAKVHVREGQLVEEGAVLAEIDDREARTAEAKAMIEAEVAQKNARNDLRVRFAKKSVEVARAELNRSIETNQRIPKSISETEMDRLRLLVEKGDLEVEQAAHDQAIADFTWKIKENDALAARQRVERHRIAAPIGGIVVQVNRHPGEWVKPGDSAARILRIDRLRAEGFLNASQVRAGLEGRAVRISVDLPDAPGAVFPGKIVFLDPELDPINAQVRVWAEVENRGLLMRPGMRAKMMVEANR